MTIDKRQVMNKQWGQNKTFIVFFLLLVIFQGIYILALSLANETIEY